MVEAAPSSRGARDAAGYVQRLGQLRVWAGKPSFRRLKALAGSTMTVDGHVVDRLPPSTASDVLAGKRLPQLPRMEVVGAFVDACLQAREVPPDVIKTVTEQWLADWRRLAGLTHPGDSGRSVALGAVADVPGYAGVEISRGTDRPLVGRKDALREFEQALDEMAAGRSQFIVVAGEPGAGKTRLLKELAAAAADRELLTLWGRSGEFEQEMRLGLVVDALDDHLEERAGWVGEQLSSEQGRLLRAVFPSLSASAERNGGCDGSTPVRPARYLVYRAVRRLLEELAAPTGLVLILDDVHWADAGSVELVDHLMRHPPRGPVLVALAHRPAQVAYRLTALIESGLGHVRQVRVNPLTLAEVEEFLGPAAGQARCRELHAASGGNAFYLEALACIQGSRTRLSSRVDLDEYAGQGAELPDALRAGVQVELRNLSPAAVQVAQAAAVVDSEFELSAVTMAAGIDEDVVLAGLDELAAHDVVRPVGSGRRFRFRHPLVRNIAYELAGPGWRLAAHARMAAYLARLDAPATARARHVERSASFGDHAAVATLSEAARTAARHAPTAAVHWLSTALRLLPSDAHAPATRQDLLLELAKLQTLTGRWPDGRETLREVLRLLPEKDHYRRARAVRFAAMIERHLGKPDQARRLLMHELRRLPDREAAVAVPLRLQLAGERLLRGDYRAALVTLDRLPDDDDAWEPGLAMAIAAMRPLPALASLQITDVLRHIQAAGKKEAATSDEHLAEWLDALAWLCWTETLIGRHRSAQRHFERAVAIARRTDHYILGTLMAGQARTHTMLGQLIPAAIAAEEAAEQSRLLGLTAPLAIALSQQCLIASWSGDHRAALRFGDQAVNTDQESQGSFTYYAQDSLDSFAHYAQAVAMINAGQFDQGAAGLDRAWHKQNILDRLTLLSSCELMAHLQATRRRTNEAITWAERADHLVHPDLLITRGHALLARAHALHATAPAAAAGHARQAAVVLIATEQPIDAGRACLHAGIYYAELGETFLAEEQLQRATQIFAACGAHALHTQAIHRLNRV